MKGILTVRGALVVLLLLVVALGSSTALAGRQVAVSSAVSMDRLDGASVVMGSLCVEKDGSVSAYGAGWGSEELVLLSVIKGADEAIIWFAGSVNEAGAFELDKVMTTRGGKGTKVLYPGAGLFTIEALGSSGRLATAPLLVVEDKCSNGESS